MATSSTSYLKTLAKGEAVAFAASLQKVKDHLNQELQWLNEQAQQKTVQLQGIETILSEAAALGLVATGTHPTAETTSAVAAPVLSAVTVNGKGVTHESALELPAAENESTSKESTSPSATEPVAAAIEPLPVRKSSRGSKASAATKTSVAKAKPATPPARKAYQRSKASNLQQFLKSPWQDKALTEAVSEILNRAAAPLSTDEVMAALYEGLPTADYQRVKHSLANTLSMGRSKGAWKSTGRGRYAGNATA